MARRVFFSFHYERDIWRAAQVRNSWVTRPDRETAGFWDAAAWEEVKKKGKDAVRKWIDQQMQGTSVTVVLIGAETATREYVMYEIERSHVTGKGMLGVRIHKLEDPDGATGSRGGDPFRNLYIEDGDGNRTYLSEIYPTYDWVDDDGYENIGSWVEQAARRAAS